MLLYSHHHYPSPSVSHLSKLKLCTHYTLTPLSPSPAPGDHPFLSLSRILTTLNSSSKWNYAVFVLLWLTYFTQHNILKGHPCGTMCQNFLPFSSWITFHCVYYHILLNHSSINGWLFLCFSIFFPPMLLVFVNNVAMNLGVQYLFKALLSYFFGGWRPRCGIAELCVNSVFHFWGSHHAVFHSSCTILLYH